MTVNPIRVILTVECVGGASFADTYELVRLANKLECHVRATIAGREVIAQPGDDPDYLYKGFGFDGYTPVQTGPITTQSVKTARNRGHQ